MSDREGPLIQRAWAMPPVAGATFTVKPIKALLVHYVEKKPNDWLDPFAGHNSPADFTNDLNPECQTLYHMDACEFLIKMKTVQPLFDGALLDPPYTIHQTNHLYSGYGLRKPISLAKDLLVDMIRPGGIVICFGFNSGGMGLKRGFEMIEVLLVCHGGSHNDTIVTVERKK